MDFHLPEIGEGVYEAEFLSWKVAVGDEVKSGQNLMEIMTDKATMDIPSPFSGIIQELHAQPGQKIKVSDLVLRYGTAHGISSTPPEIQATPVSTPISERAELRSALPVPSNGDREPTVIRAAPSVRQMARKMGIDLAQVQGTGPEQRILIDDLTAYLQSRAVGSAPVAAPAKMPPPPNLGKPGTRIKLQGLRRKIAEQMVRSKHTIPHYSYVDECDVTELVRLREQLRESFSSKGIKLTYLAFVLKAVGLALREFPIVNASLDDATEEIIFHDRYHVGLAVATPNGLIVPVIQDVHQKDVATIAREIDALGSAARSGKIRLEELRGGTFTVTSVGNIGGLISTPVINHPEVGILGVGKIVKRPVFDAQGQVRAADMVYLSFSFDHRVVDGAVGAAFANVVLKYLQKPALLLLGADFHRNT